MFFGSWEINEKIYVSTLSFLISLFVICPKLCSSWKLKFLFPFLNHKSEFKFKWILVGFFFFKVFSYKSKSVYIQFNCMYKYCSNLPTFIFLLYYAWCLFFAMRTSISHTPLQFVTTSSKPSCDKKVCWWQNWRIKLKHDEPL